MEHKYNWVDCCPGNPSLVTWMERAVWPCVKPRKSVFFPCSRASDAPSLSLIPHGSPNVFPGLQVVVGLL